MIFQSTSLSRGKTTGRSGRIGRITFQSTSLSRGKTLLQSLLPCTQDLSIHFPLTREDHGNGGKESENDLSIHFPLTREDCDIFFPFNPFYLSIHFPLTREDYIRRLWRLIPGLSIHFPLTREDPALSHAACHIGIFQSTSLSRGKTLQPFQCGSFTCLSIHFPLTREDNSY